jgi:NADH-quinone oxidoreductase subunit N
VAIVVGSMISLGYYLPVIAAIWMRKAPASETTRGAGAPAPAPSALPVLAGGSPELDEPPALVKGTQPEVLLVAVLAAAATVFFGILPQPLFDLVSHAGGALGGLF